MRKHDLQQKLIFLSGFVLRIWWCINTISSSSYRFFSFFTPYSGSLVSKQILFTGFELFGQFLFWDYSLNHFYCFFEDHICDSQGKFWADCQWGSMVRVALKHNRKAIGCWSNWSSGARVSGEPNNEGFFKYLKSEK